MINEMAMDTLWVLLATMLVFFMNLGFAALESGFARSKNTVNILSKNFVVFAVSGLGFLLLGWGLMFGGDNPVIGTQGLWILGKIDETVYTLSANVPFWSKVIFQMVFCGTAATIVSGAVAERIKYISFIVFSFALTLVIYPIVGHWIWGGGFLSSMGFLDFAGSTMSMSNPQDVAHIFITTNISAVAGVLTSTVVSWLLLGKPDLGMTINGCLAGLVGITAGCAYVSVLSSLIIGAIAGAIVVFAVLMFDKLKLDDPVGATSVHLANGIFGTICVGLFAQEGVTSISGTNGLFFGGGFSLLGVQLWGILVVAAFIFPVSVLVWIVIKKTFGLRVSLEEEITGLDVGEHGNSAYPEFQSRRPDYIAIISDGVEAE
ncbi:MAG: ammonium transporter [Clostridiales bacterium]|jgi:Amt family ammonium transporter|nr:ammonium transporter [Clostridiales bacterium]